MYWGRPHKGLEKEGRGKERWDGMEGREEKRERAKKMGWKRKKVGNRRRGNDSLHSLI